MPNGQTTVRVNRLWYGYANAVEKWLARMERATDEGIAGQYTPQSWLSDMVASWSDTVDLWNLPYKVCDERLRVVVFEITAATDDVTQTILIPNPGAVVLEADDFVDGVGNVVLPVLNHVEVNTADGGRTLVVRLYDLVALAIPAGTYESPVHPQGSATKVALVRVIVS
jgi:hypothetical protein